MDKAHRRRSGAGTMAMVDGVFLRRRNRFAADVRIGRRTANAYLPNTGRMRELLAAGSRVMLRPAGAPERRTRYDLVLVRHAGRWVGLDARMPPRMVVAAWRRGLLPSLAGFGAVRPEVRFADSRLDLCFTAGNSRCYVETKSVNRVEDGLALFPDAPTQRGAKHLHTLAQAVRDGHRAAVVFVVQRDDALALAPFASTDPSFAEALREACAAGVQALALVCRVSPHSMRPARTIPVLLDGMAR